MSVWKNKKHLNIAFKALLRESVAIQRLYVYTVPSSDLPRWFRGGVCVWGGGTSDGYVTVLHTIAQSFGLKC